MRTTFLMLSMLAGAASIATASPLQNQTPALSQEALSSFAACGWYAISACSPSHAEAQNFASQHGTGYVINTSSPEFPNFRPGYFCVVNGPMSYGAANSTVARLRRVSPTAYAKNGC